MRELSDQQSYRQFSLKGAENVIPFRFARVFPHFVKNNRNYAFLHKRLNSVAAQHIVKLVFAVQIQRFRLTGYFEKSRNKSHYSKKSRTNVKLLVCRWFPTIWENCLKKCLKLGKTRTKRKGSTFSGGNPHLLMKTVHDKVAMGDPQRCDQFQSVCFFHVLTWNFQHIFYHQFANNVQCAIFFLSTFSWKMC